MNASRQDESSLLIEKVALRFRQQGFEVKMNPNASDIPFALGTYRPDLLLREPSGQNYIVEIKRKQAPSIDRLREIAKTVSQHEGWRFLLVTEDVDTALDVNLTSDNLLRVEQISQRLTDAQRLLGEGQAEAAFLLIWPAFEAALRRHALAADLPIERLPLTSLINHLYSEGELSMDQYELATSLAKIRNSAAHGYQTEGLDQAVRLLGQFIQDLIQSDPSSETVV